MIGNIIPFQMVRDRSSTMDRGSPPPDAQPVAGKEGRTDAAQPRVSVEPTVGAAAVADPVVERSEAQPTVQQLLMQVVQMMGSSPAGGAVTSACEEVRGVRPPPAFATPATEATVVATTTDILPMPVVSPPEVWKILAHFLQLTPVRFSGASV